MAVDRGPLTNVLTWIFTSVASTFVALRILSRLKLSKVAGWDDLVIGISLLVVLVLSASTSYAVSQGLGRHFSTLSQSEAVNAAKWTFVADTICIISFTIPKLGVAILLSRVLTVGKPSLRHQLILYSPAIFMIAFSCAAFGVWLGICHPLGEIWNKAMNANCLSVSGEVYLGIVMAVNCTSAATDFFYGIYPMTFISKLNMDSRRKFHFSLMFGLGSVGGAVAIWKTTKFPSISDPHADFTFESAPLIYATTIEADVIIIASCIPTIGPVAQIMRLKASTLGSKLQVFSSGSYHQFDGERGATPFPSPGNPGPSPTSDRTLQTYELPQLENGNTEDRSQFRLPEVEVLAETVVDVSISPNRSSV